jgi:hypothetical protein
MSKQSEIVNAALEQLKVALEKLKNGEVPELSNIKKNLQITKTTIEKMNEKKISEEEMNDVLEGVVKDIGK